jgi:hypothetical protein
MSPNRHYRRGYEAERRTEAAFRADGYVVWRPGGSLGEADLIAAKPRQLVLVQVKAGEATLADGWWNDLHRLAAWLDAIPVVADWPKRGQLRLRRITGPHHKRSKLWPCRVFLLDEVDAAARWQP